MRRTRMRMAPITFTLHPERREWEKPTQAYRHRSPRVNDAPAGAEQDDRDPGGRRATPSARPTSASAIRTTRPATLCSRPDHDGAPATGRSTDNGGAGVPATFIPVADIAAASSSSRRPPTPTGRLRQLHFQVRDDGGTANGGVDVDPSPNTITFDVDGGQRRPGGHQQDRRPPGGHGLHVRRGRLRLHRSQRRARRTLTGGQDHARCRRTARSEQRRRGHAGPSIAIADIDAGKLVFTPAANANGPRYANFTFQVQDNGGTATAASTSTRRPNTITINVTAVNDAPTGANNTISDAARTRPTPSPPPTSASPIRTTPPRQQPHGSQDHDPPRRGSSGQLAPSCAALIPLADITGNKLVFTPVGKCQRRPVRDVHLPGAGRRRTATAESISIRPRKPSPST